MAFFGGPSGPANTTSTEPSENYPDRYFAVARLLQSGPNGKFVGGFKNLFNATLGSRDEMTGGIDAYLYSYADPATGAALVDSDGQFSFIVRRVKVH
jgi:hypothetical protein